MPPKSRQPDPVLALAARQHGNVTYRQLLALGLSADTIKYRARSGRLHRVYRGVYAVGRPPQTVLERAAAAVLACGSGAALSHFGALKLWGLAREWPRDFEVTVPRDVRPAGVTTHHIPTLLRTDIRIQLGIRTTSPARTLLDCAPRLAAKQLKRAVNDARLAHILNLAQLADVIERCPHHPGTTRLHPFIESTAAPTRSPMEDDFDAFCTRYRLPQPLINAVIAGAERDAYFPQQKLIVELDSWQFHQGRDAFEGDRDRDADALAQGIATVRVTWERLKQRPDEEAARLERILRERSG
jgi:hypothetical protein